MGLPHSVYRLTWKPGIQTRNRYIRARPTPISAATKTNPSPSFLML